CSKSVNATERSTGMAVATCSMRSTSVVLASAIPSSTTSRSQARRRGNQTLKFTEVEDHDSADVPRGTRPRREGEGVASNERVLDASRVEPTVDVGRDGL